MLSSSVAVDESTNIKPSKAVFLGWILEVTKFYFLTLLLIIAYLQHQHLR